MEGSEDLLVVTSFDDDEDGSAERKIPTMIASAETRPAIQAERRMREGFWPAGTGDVVGGVAAGIVNAEAV